MRRGAAPGTEVEEAMGVGAALELEGDTNVPAVLGLESTVPSDALGKGRLGGMGNRCGPTGTVVVGVATKADGTGRVGAGGRGRRGWKGP